MMIVVVQCLVWYLISVFAQIRSQENLLNKKLETGIDQF